MIHWRRKDFNNPPAKLTTTNCAKQIESAVRGKNGDLYTTTYYQDDEVLNALRAYSIDKDIFDEETDQAKCFYCESFSEVVATLQVEHYRPKAKICDEKNNVIPGSNGYYWLGCEWSNLLLACPKCNGPGAKGNKFPINGKRTLDCNPIRSAGRVPIFDRTECFANGSPLLDEDPLLINPEVDEVINSFRFSKDGKIEGINNKGEKSVEIYGLDRHQLNIARSKVKQELLSGINLVLLGLERGYFGFDGAKMMLVEVCKKIINANHPTRAYTLWARYFNLNFEDCFVSEQPDSYKDLLREAYFEATN